MAGQGTAGLEIAQQCAEMGVTPDHVISCCGGGGLIAGVSVAIRSELPTAKIWAAEPADFDDTIRSLASGSIETVDPAARSICDAVVTPAPGEMTFAINRTTLAGGFGVSDDLVLRVMATTFKHLKLVIEPGGAVALAAALDRRLPADTGCAVAVASGGNVDAEMFSRALAAGALVSGCCTGGRQAGGDVPNTQRVKSRPSPPARISRPAPSYRLSSPPRHSDGHHNTCLYFGPHSPALIQAPMTAHNSLSAWMKVVRASLSVSEIFTRFMPNTLPPFTMPWMKALI